MITLKSLRNYLSSPSKKEKPKIGKKKIIQTYFVPIFSPNQINDEELQNNSFDPRLAIGEIRFHITSCGKTISKGNESQSPVDKSKKSSKSDKSKKTKSNSDLTSIEEKQDHDVFYQWRERILTKERSEEEINKSKEENERSKKIIVDADLRLSSGQSIPVPENNDASSDSSDSYEASTNSGSYDLSETYTISEGYDDGQNIPIVKEQIDTDKRISNYDESGSYDDGDGSQPVITVKSSENIKIVEKGKENSSPVLNSHIPHANSENSLSLG